PRIPRREGFPSQFGAAPGFATATSRLHSSRLRERLIRLRELSGATAIPITITSSAPMLENNVVLHKVLNGIRVSIAPIGLPSRAYGVKHSIASQHWAILRVTFQGKLFTVFLNGERLFVAEDGSIESAGKTGLWTKADSVTYFDNFEVKQK